MPFPQTLALPSQQCSTAPPATGFTNLEWSFAGKTDIPSIMTGGNQEPGYASISPSSQIHISANTDSETLLRLLHFERQMHQSTLEALQGRDQRVRAVEEELQRKENVLHNWASWFSRCSDLLRGKDDEIQRLRSRMQILDGKEHFQLDRAAPKDRQIKVLKTKIARMRRRNPVIDDSASVVESDRNKGPNGIVAEENAIRAEPTSPGHTR